MYNLTKFHQSLIGMAQAMFQMQRLWNGFKHEKLQRIQQGTVLRSVSRFYRTYFMEIAEIIFTLLLIFLVK